MILDYDLGNINEMSAENFKYLTDSCFCLKKMIKAWYDHFEFEIENFKLKLTEFDK